MLFFVSRAHESESREREGQPQRRMLPDMIKLDEPPFGRQNTNYEAGTSASEPRRMDGKPLLGDVWLTDACHERGTLRSTRRLNYFPG